MTTTDQRPQLRETLCAICDANPPALELYAANLDMQAFTSRVFSARRTPDRLHYRLVRCSACGLVRSDPVLETEALRELYEQSTFDYATELDGLRATYGRALQEVSGCLESPGGLLDIGCGSGFVLEVAKQHGWAEVHGVEPSIDAIAKARPDIAPTIVQDMMRPGLFPNESLSAVTLFQVLDHIADPVALLRDCREILRPGGVIMAFNHDVTSWSARLLGERSPIIDVEHMYLYSPDTMRLLFEKAGFDVLSVAPVRNTYSLAYLTHLIPLPTRLKQFALERLGQTAVGRRELTVPLGNLRLLARRPR